MTQADTYSLVTGLVHALPATKQDLGRRFAVHLGLTPGPAGADDGIDGTGEVDGKKIYFQCKLRETPLDVNEARILAAEIDYHRADVAVMLAGVGYKETFRARLQAQPAARRAVIHLLTLSDLFEHGEALQRALEDLPPLRDLREVKPGWRPGDPTL